ncbi:hypothetical protein SAMN05216388_10382 [Halorientalis persicus]|uniref:Uncharacterized protein n=1 Tax=Halorientalis persicus TaxID=1367881 RepID=A0A1H8VHZ6_9EURY|nr:hypothetical protein SAMN05216388_10382 [Halorientalis persicus]
MNHHLMGRYTERMFTPNASEEKYVYPNLDSEILSSCDGAIGFPIILI